MVTANLPTGSMLALLLTALTAANPFSAFAVTLEPVALMLQRKLWSKTQQQKRQDSSAGGKGAGSSSGDRDGTDQASSSSTEQQPPYPVRAVVRLGGWLVRTSCALRSLLLLPCLF